MTCTIDNNVEALLRSCRVAESQDALGSALGDLSEHIPNLPQPQRESIAFFLVNDLGITGSGIVVEKVDKCLEACGLYLILSTVCVSTLLDAATAACAEPRKSAETPPLALHTVFRTIRRLLLTIPDKNDTILNPNKFFQTRLILSFETSCEHASEGKTGHNTTIDDLVTMVLLFPVRVAAACHTQGLMLPSWAVKSNFSPRLVRCVLTSTITAIRDNNDNQATAMRGFTCSLIRTMILHGASNHVATGLHQCFLDQKQSDREEFGQVIFEAFKSISNPRNIATLMKTILQHLIAAMDESPPPLSKQQVDAASRKHLLPYLLLTCRPIIEHSRAAQESWITSIILCKSLPISKVQQQRCVSHSVALVLLNSRDNGKEESDSDDDSHCASDELSSPFRLLWRGLRQVADTWCQRTYIQHTDISAQRHSTMFLNSALSMLPTEDTDAIDMSGSALLLNLSNGVTARLGSGVRGIRIDGMYIAEHLAILLRQPPLRFDELDEEREAEVVDKEEISDSPKSRLDETSQRISELKVVGADRKKRRGRTKNSLIDPDEEYNSCSEEEESSICSSQEQERETPFDDDDSIWDDGNDELVPYNLEDDEEDLRETPRPLYLRDCLTLLRAAETEDTAYSQHEAALQELDKLVRSRPPDLADYAVPLAKQLLYMQNSFSLQDFDELRQRGLVGLAVETPWPVVQLLTNELFGGISLGIRMEILDTITEAARELSGAKALDLQRETRKKLSGQAFTAKPKVSGKLGLVAHSSQSTTRDREVVSHTGSDLSGVDESRTRRWGRGLKEDGGVSSTVSNRFGPVAPMIFYALLNAFLQCKDDASIWGGDTGSHLLACFLSALADLVVCSGNHPGTDLLAADVLKLSWSFRHVEAPQVRAAVLEAIGKSLSILPDHVRMSVVSLNEADGLTDYLCRTRVEDSDVTCRQLAEGLSIMLASAISSIMEGGVGGTLMS